MSIPLLNHISSIQCSQVRKRYRNASIFDVIGLFYQSNFDYGTHRLNLLQIPVGAWRISEVCCACGTSSMFTTPD